MWFWGGSKVVLGWVWVVLGVSGVVLGLFWVLGWLWGGSMVFLGWFWVLLGGSGVFMGGSGGVLGRFCDSVMLCVVLGLVLG